MGFGIGLLLIMLLLVVALVVFGCWVVGLGCLGWFGFGLLTWVV